jgi:Co/Zn/Cd efflux system component
LVRPALYTDHFALDQHFPKLVTHHRSDAFSSIGTMLGIGGAISLGEKWHILDPLAAVIVSLFIVKVAFDISSGSIKELTEESWADGVEDEIVQIASSIRGVAYPHNVRARRIGSDIAVDLHVLRQSLQERQQCMFSLFLAVLIKARCLSLATFIPTIRYSLD